MERHMVRLLTLLLAILPALAFAQGGPVQQSGPITPGHIPSWATNGVIQDAGPATNGKVTNLGLLGTGVPFCINDAPAGSIGGWHQLCLGANASGGGLISYNALGGATALPLQCIVNGVTSNCGVSGGGAGGLNTQVQYNNLGSLAGDSTFTFNNSTKAVSIGTTALIGNGSTNYWTLTGSSGSPLIAVAGSGNLFAQIKGLGNFGPLLQSSGGGNIAEFASSGTVGNFLIVTAEPLGTPVEINSSDSTDHEGIQFIAPTTVEHNFIFSGVAAIANENFIGSTTITSGVSAQPGDGTYGINEFLLNAAMTTSASLATLAVQSTYNTGFYGAANTVTAAETMGGTPTLPSAWAATTSYSTVGQLVLSSTNEYALVTAGTSGAGASFTGAISGTTLTVTGLTGTLIANMAVQDTGGNILNGTYITAPCSSTCTVNKSQTVTSEAMTAGGPAGFGSSIADGGSGSAVWRFVNGYSQAWYHTTLASQNGLIHSLGGTSTNPLGFAFGLGAGVYMACATYPTDCATNVNEAVGAEIDAFMDTGTSALDRTGLQIVGGGTGGRGFVDDAGLRIATSSGLPNSQFLYSIFVSNTAANGVAEEFWDTGAGAQQHVAGVIDMLRVVADGSTITAYTAGGSVGFGGGGGGYLIRWANGLLSNSTGPFAGGALELGAGVISPAGGGLTLDVPSYMICGGVLTGPTCSPAIVSPGTNWYGSGNHSYASDAYGDYGQVTVANGVVTALTVLVAQPSATNNSGTQTWYPEAASQANTPGGSNLPPSSFTVTEAWSRPAGPITLGGTSPLATFGDAASVPLHLATAQTTAPALTSCGGGTPTIVGSDTAGTVTMGTGATGCTITFNVAYTGTPHCVVTWHNTPLASESYAVSNTAITLTQTSTSSDVAEYVCMAPAGG